ncbi:MAG: class I SAM-dependent methyltransferase [Bacteroidota bacterium]|nr:class I SAM-dependent methyltransferase [Bacteroidota bacterium]
MPIISRTPDSHVLDIGCGYGELLMLLNAKGFTNTSGIDISPQQIELAKELNVPNVQVADAFTYLYTQKNTFDLITGIDIIEHFSKDELVRLLSNIKHSLKEGGIAIFRTPNMDAPFTSTYAFGDFTHQSFLNYSSAEQLFRSIGFSDVQVLPSYIKVKGKFRELLRKVIWKYVTLHSKLVLFATGKSTKGVYFTPNLLIKIRK